MSLGRQVWRMNAASRATASSGRNDVRPVGSGHNRRIATNRVRIISVCALARCNRRSGSKASACDATQSQVLPGSEPGDMGNRYLIVGKASGGHVCRGVEQSLGGDVETFPDRRLRQWCEFYHPLRSRKDALRIGHRWPRWPCFMRPISARSAPKANRKARSSSSSSTSDRAAIQARSPARLRSNASTSPSTMATRCRASAWSSGEADCTGSVRRPLRLRPPRPSEGRPPARSRQRGNPTGRSGRARRSRGRSSRR